MNLFRKHKKFEEQLKEQLSDMEFKPSTSLWDRIDSDITKDGFETNIQYSLENFEQVPYSDTWDKIAAELPEEKTGKHLFRYYGWSALTLLFAVGVWVGYEWNKQGDTLIAATQNSVSTEKIPAEKNNTIAPQRKVETSNIIIPSPETPSKIAPIEQQAFMPVDEGKQQLSVIPQSSALKGQSNAEPKQLNLLAAKRPVISKRVINTKPSEKSSSPATSQRLATTTEIASTPLNESSVENVADIKEPVKTEPVILSVTPLAKSTETPQQPVVVAQTDVREVSSPMQPDSASNMAPPVRAKQDDLTRFSLSIMAGAHMSYMTYTTPSDPQFNFGENIALRKKLERPDIDWSGGFLIDYRLSDKWMISTGLMMVNFNQQFYYDTLSPSSPVNPNETFGAVYQSTDSVITGNKYSNRIKYSWNEIPIYVNYNLHRGQRWDIDLQAGAGYAFISTVDAGMVSYDNKGVFALKDKDAFPQIKSSVFVSVMPQVSYRFGQNVSIGFIPTVKYSVTSMIGNDRWVQQYPYFVGMNICLRKRF
ncbi:MAG: hypothetical protein V4651_10060 [Bacteroidota bacterium]